MHTGDSHPPTPAKEKYQKYDTMVLKMQIIRRQRAVIFERQETNEVRPTPAPADWEAVGCREGKGEEEGRQVEARSLPELRRQSWESGEIRCLSSQDRV